MDAASIIATVNTYQNGDDNSFTLLYQMFSKLISFYGKRIGSDDALQDLNLFFIELIQSLDTDQFHDDVSAQKYISVCIRNKYIQLSKQQQSYVFSYAPFCDGIAEDKKYDDNKIFICEALSRLTDKQSKIIVYKYIYEYSDSEIAESLKITRQSVNRLKNRALVILREFYNVK